MSASSSNALPTVVAVIAVLLNRLAMGAVPPRSTIDNPCRITGPASREFSPLNSQFTDTIVEINAVKSAAQQLMTALQGEGFLTSADIAILNAGYSHLPGVPLRVEADNLTVENMVTILLQDYHDVSVYIIFVKQALAEQLALDGGLLTNEISLLESNLFALLCKVNTLLSSQNEIVSTFVNSSAMPSHLKNIVDSTERYQRNYLLVKDAKIFLNNVAMNYASLLESVQA